ncbi:hypothetical protein MRX96_054482 [Rhipicephalus microplus]
MRARVPLRDYYDRRHGTAPEVCGEHFDSVEMRPACASLEHLSLLSNPSSFPFSPRVVDHCSARVEEKGERKRTVRACVDTAVTAARRNRGNEVVNTVNTIIPKPETRSRPLRSARLAAAATNRLIQVVTAVSSSTPRRIRRGFPLLFRRFPHVFVLLVPKLALILAACCVVVFVAVISRRYIYAFPNVNFVGYERAFLCSPVIGCAAETRSAANCTCYSHADARERRRVFFFSIFNAHASHPANVVSADGVSFLFLLNLFRV